MAVSMFSRRPPISSPVKFGTPPAAASTSAAPTAATAGVAGYGLTENVKQIQAHKILMRLNKTLGLVSSDEFEPIKLQALLESAPYRAPYRAFVDSIKLTDNSKIEHDAEKATVLLRQIQLQRLREKEEKDKGASSSNPAFVYKRTAYVSGALFGLSSYYFGFGALAKGLLGLTALSGGVSQIHGPLTTAQKNVIAKKNAALKGLQNFTDMLNKKAEVPKSVREAGKSLGTGSIAALVSAPLLGSLPAVGIGIASAAAVNAWNMEPPPAPSDEVTGYTLLANQQALEKKEQSDFLVGVIQDIESGLQSVMNLTDLKGAIAKDKKLFAHFSEAFVSDAQKENSVENAKNAFFKREVFQEKLGDYLKKQQEAQAKAAAATTTDSNSASEASSSAQQSSSSDTSDASPASSTAQTKFGQDPTQGEATQTDSQQGTAKPGFLETVSGMATNLWNRLPSLGSKKEAAAASNTSAASSTASAKEVTAAAPTSSVEDKKTTNETNENEATTEAQSNEETIWNGYAGTKMVLGGGLLAGGIALKLTLIGIIPGLGMAAAGAGLMGWGLYNWMNRPSEKTTEETKDA